MPRTISLHRFIGTTPSSSSLSQHHRHYYSFTITLIIILRLPSSHTQPTSTTINNGNPPSYSTTSPRLHTFNQTKPLSDANPTTLTPRLSHDPAQEYIHYRPSPAIPFSTKYTRYNKYNNHIIRIFPTSHSPRYHHFIFNTSPPPLHHLLSHPPSIQPH